MAVWGAAFKAGTDDVRDSVGLRVAGQLQSRGAEVTVYDPMGCANALMDFPKLIYTDTALAAAVHADMIVVVTAWPEFSRIDAAEVTGVVRGKVIVDACQSISIAAWRDAGPPVVTTAVGGLMEAVRDYPRALQVPPRDPVALRAALLRLPERRGCSYADPHSWSHTGHNFTTR